MSPTNEQIIAEAERRWLEEYKANGGKLSPHSSKEIHVINIMRENWTPPEPVDPDLLAFREWFADLWNAYAEVLPGRSAKSIILEGASDNTEQATAYLAGARMAREQERERAKVLEAYVKLDEHGPHLWTRERARKVLAKYRGEA